MATYRIAVIPGDGIGAEVVAEGIKVLEAVAKAMPGCGFRFTSFGWGTEFYLKHGHMMPPDGLRTLQEMDAIYLGAIGDPRLPDHLTLDGLLLPIRRGFDQYVCLRPAFLYAGVPSPLAGKTPGCIDLMVVRENTEGEYAQAGGRLYRGQPNEVAIQTAIYTRAGCDRVMRFAFDLARRRRRRLTSVTKSNAQGYGMVMWDEVFRDAARDYPDVATDSVLVDAACMAMVLRPERFDVVVASNLFGDILTDLSAAVVGSPGLAPSANLNPPRRFPSMFEPVHGSAPDIAGQGIANPMAAILSAAMMLEFLGVAQAAARVQAAAARVLQDGRVRTPDLGGRARTAEVGDAVVAALADAA
jgi:tartrate dehydrogenase/decarboxylase/D-malate dehydrogenase